MGMNKIRANLTDIKGKSIKLLTFKSGKEIFRVLGLDDYEKDREYFLEINPSKLFLSKEKFDFENRIEVNIKEIKKVDVLLNILCEWEGVEFEVLMIEDLVNFKDKAYLYFRASDVLIEEVDD